MEFNILGDWLWDLLGVCVGSANRGGWGGVGPVRINLQGLHQHEPSEEQQRKLPDKRNEETMIMTSATQGHPRSSIRSCPMRFPPPFMCFTGIRTLMACMSAVGVAAANRARLAVLQSEESNGQT
eukprot:259909-Amphidinium_carterae.1